MSDVWQGPGWWLAPDGKWYPEDGGPTESAKADAARAPAASEALDGGQVLTRDRGSLAPPPPETIDDDAPPGAEPEIISQPAGDHDHVAVDELAPGADGTVHEAAVAGAEPAATGMVGEGAVDETTSEPARGGWTAVEPEAAAAVEPDLTDDADGAIDLETDEESAAPPRPSSTVVSPTRPVAATTAIERDEAWRKPGDVGKPSNGPPAAGAPAVVDVTEATESLAQPDEFVPPSPWRGVLLALGFLAAIIGLSILLGLFFTNVVFDGDDEDVATDGSTTTTQSAPSTEAPTTTEATSVAPTTADPAGGIEVSVFELETGDCIEGDIGTGPLERLVRVDCAVPHQFEVYAEDVLDPSITEFDEEAINVAAEQICRDALDAYIPADDDRDIQFKWFQPTAESWSQEGEPDRSTTCLLFDADGPMTGRAA